MSDQLVTAKPHRELVTVDGGTVAIPMFDTNAARVYLAQLAPTGRRAQRSALARIAAMLGGTIDATPWSQLRYEHVQAILTHFALELAPATANRYRAAIRGVVREAYRLGQMDADTYQRILQAKGVRGSRELAGRALSRLEVARILDAARSDHTDSGTRDVAILAVGYNAGLRRQEMAGLRYTDVTGCDVTGCDVTALALRVLGKGNKERTVYLENGAADALRTWMALRGDADGALFWRGRKGGRISRGDGMTAQSIRNVIKRRAAQAGVEDVTPHNFRRTFVTHMLDAGVDLLTVAAMAGHSDPKTTARYDRRGERAKRSAAARLTLP